MRYLYAKADEKFVRIPAKQKKKSPLSSFEFYINPIIQGKTDVKEFDKTDVPIVFKCSPDTLLNICVKVLDAFPLPMVYTWTIEDVCKWLRECGYRQYQHTFRQNLINGRSLLLLDASALAAINIKDFAHIKDLSGRIRGLFYFEITKFGRSLTLYPEFPNELYKLFRIKTGAKYDVPRSNLWRKMQIIRQDEPNYLHWEILERWLSFGNNPKPNEKIGLTRRSNLYACNAKVAENVVAQKHSEHCSCLPPCACHFNVLHSRPPWRLKCLPPSNAGAEFVDVSCTCVPPCTCRWPSKVYQTQSILTCLQRVLPNKYGGVPGQNRYRQFEMLPFRFSI